MPPQRSWFLASTASHGTRWYLGFLLLLLAEIVWLANPIALLIAPAFVLYLNEFQIGPEESVLQSRFGAEFQSYTHRVRRWI
jgi:protein-S-isoprenylcysteine O-methyltransferase Ste14